MLFYIFFLLFFTYPIGIAVTEFFVLILIIHFIKNNRKIEYYQTKIFLFLFVFSLYVFLNSIAQIPYIDLKISAIFHLRFLLFALSIFFILDNSEKISLKKKNFFFIIISIISFIIIDSLLQFFSGKNFFGFEIISHRVSSIFFEELILGSFFVKTLPFLFWIIFFLKIDITKYRLLLSIYISLIFIVIYLSGERTSLALTMVSSVLFLYFIKSLRKILTTSLIILSIFVICTGLFDIGKSSIFNRVFIKTYNQIFVDKNFNNKSINSTSEEINKEESNKIYFFSKDHQGHYLLAYDIFTKSPFFGVGPKGFRSECRKMEYDPNVGICSTHPHNFIFQFLSELGLVGLIFYIFGLIYLIIKMFQVKRENIDLNIKNCFLISSIGIIINLFPLLPSGNFFNNWISIMIYYYIGIYLYSLKKCNKNL